VSQLIINPILAQPRIVNFSEIILQAPDVLTFQDQSPTEIVRLLRHYSDRPQVYVVGEGYSARLTEVLEILKTIRSTCYPHALFLTNGTSFRPVDPDLDLIVLKSDDSAQIVEQIHVYSREKFSFDRALLDNNNTRPLPEQVDVLIVGGGITGLYAAHRLAEQKKSFCVVEARDIAGGIWSKFANASSQVNTSEAAYRVLERNSRTNRDHSTTVEILKDLHQVSQEISEHLFTRTRAERFVRKQDIYRTTVLRRGVRSVIESKGLILAVNDRIGEPRIITWENQHRFQGIVRAGIADEALDIEWRDKKVVVIGMGAFAVENVRTALENGARHVTVICRRHGTVCPKIIDYLNFATPYDEKFLHDRKSNIRNMMLWKKLYDLSGATQPECWMGKIKHEGHTISVSDIWFIAHFLKKLATVSGSVTGLYDTGVLVNHQERIEADIVINCVGFHRNAPVVKKMCDYTEMYNNNYIDKDVMYLADAYIDDDVFNSFFGSSVLEMTKFYMDVYLDFFDNDEFGKMITSEGIEKISIDDRRWSHYIAGAESLIRNYPRFYDIARKQIDERTAHFIESHDLNMYVAANKREWFDLHASLLGRAVSQDECLPYVFEKLVEKKI